MSPQRRPSARELADELRTLPKRKRKGGTKPAAPDRSLPTVARERLLPGALAGVASGWVALKLPFYPPGWPLGLAGAGAALGFTWPRAGLAFALATAFFPLANISLGLALLYAVVALAWLALSWRDARAGLLLAAGPLLAPLAALGLLPLAVQLAHGRVRRAAQAAGAVLLAALVAGVRHVALPFDGAPPPLGLGITASNRPTAVARTLVHQLQAHPALAIEAVVLAAAAVALPYIRGRGPWAAAVYGGALLAGTVLAAPNAAALPLIAAAWLTAGVVAIKT